MSIAKSFPQVDMTATGQNILRLRKERGLTVQELQEWFRFSSPRSIYKWQEGKALPSIDNLIALSEALDVPVMDIIIVKKPQAVPAVSCVYRDYSLAS